MNFAKTCTTCLRSSRLYSVPRNRAAGTVRSLSAFSPSSPALKKHSKQRASEFEQEFEEDLFDDVDAPLETAADVTRSTVGGGGRDLAHAESIARVQEITSLPRFRLSSNVPSPSILTSLVTHSTRSNLVDTLESIKAWRRKGLPLLSDQAVQILVKRLADAEGATTLRAADILGDRAQYGVEINDISSLYPLFVRLSRPEPITGGGDLAHQASVCFDLLTLAQQHSPSTTSTDSFAHLSTLAIALQSGKTRSSLRTESVIHHLQQLGEDYILQETTSKLAKRSREVVRFRAMRVTDELRKKQHGEVEWFAHLAERLVALTK